MKPEELPTSPFCDLLGIETLEVSTDRAVVAITIEDKHCNALDTVHGGLIFTLADRAFGIAENTEGRPFVAMEMHVRYLRPARVGQRLTATATRRHAGRQTQFYQIEVTDENDRLIACLTGTGHLFKTTADKA